MAIPVRACRVCRSRELEQILSLGEMPPVNSFLSGPEAIAVERRHPLAIALCMQCSHVQLTHMLDPREIFEDYIYFSAMSDTIVRWGQRLAKRYREEMPLAQGDLVAELASNDGCILRPFQRFSRIYGVEPAKNIAEVANREGIPTRADFFNSTLARELRREVGPARLIIARNVVAHVPEVVDFVSGVAHWLSDDGIFHVEVPYLRRMVEGLQFDTIYHEHLSYFSVTAVNKLFSEAGLELWDVEEIPLHGGSLIARGRKRAQPTESVGAFLQEEQALGFTGTTRLRTFAQQVQDLKSMIPEFLRKIRNAGQRIAGYGAAAKGVVLTNFCGIGPELLEFVADRSPYKQGKLMPGTHLPVVAPQRVTEARTEYLLILAWNLVHEITAQLDEYRRAGGRFIVPVPAPVVLAGGEA